MTALTRKMAPPWYKNYYIYIYDHIIYVYMYRQIQYIHIMDIMVMFFDHIWAILFYKPAFLSTWNLCLAQFMMLHFCDLFLLLMQMCCSAMSIGLEIHVWVKYIKSNLLPLKLYINCTVPHVRGKHILKFFEGSLLLCYLDVYNKLFLRCFPQYMDH